MRARTTHSSGAWQAIVRRACMAAGVKREAARVVAQVELIYRGSLEVNAGAGRLADYVGVSERTVRRAAEVACEVGFWTPLHSKGQRLHLRFAATEALLEGQPGAIWAEGLSEYPEQTPDMVTGVDPGHGDRGAGVRRSGCPTHPGHGDRSTPDTVTYPTPDTVTYPPPDPGHGDRGGSDTVTGGSGHGDRTAEASSIRKQQQQQHPQPAASSSVPGSARGPGAAAAAAGAPPEELGRDPIGELTRSALAAVGVEPDSAFGGELLDALVGLEPSGIQRVLERARSQANPGGALRSALAGGYLADWAAEPTASDGRPDLHAEPAQPRTGAWDFELEDLALWFARPSGDPRFESARRTAESRARLSAWGSVEGVLEAQAAQIAALPPHVAPKVRAAWGLDGWREWARERTGEPEQTTEPEPAYMQVLRTGLAS